MMNTSKSKFYKTLLLCVAFAVIGLQLFYNLGKLPIQLWDEARLGVSALEMYSGNANLLVLTVDGRPDMWSTKPPFLIWCQAVSMKLFGISEFGLRFPSAMAALATCLFIYWFLRKKYGSSFPGLASALILVSTPGYVMQHGVRSADYDSMLVLFLTVYAGLFYWFVETGNKKYFYTAMLFITAAVFTKGIAGGFFVPALIIYAAWKKKAGPILKSVNCWLSILVSVSLLVCYYLLREKYTPGYWAAVCKSELGGRFLEANEGHFGGILFYARNMVTKEYTYWIPMLVFALFSHLLLKSWRDSMVVYVFLVVSTFFTILTLSVTKLTWYSMPLYPFISMFIGTAIYKSVSTIAVKYKVEITKAKAVACLAIALICIYPYSTLFGKTINKYDNDRLDTDANAIVAWLQKKVRNEDDTTHVKIIWKEYRADILWYIKAAALLDKPVERGNIYQLQPSDNVMLYEPELRAILEKRYNYILVDKTADMVHYKIR